MTGRSSQPACPTFPTNGGCANPSPPSSGLPGATDTWLSTKQVAELLDTYPAKVRRCLDRYTWREAPGLGGGQQRVIQIALSSLPMPAQREYFEANRPALTAVQLDPLLVDLDVRECLPDWARDRADERQRILRDFDRYYADRWRERHLKEALEAWCADKEYSAITLYRWRRDHARDGYAGLVPEYGNRAGFAVLSDAEKGEIRRIYCIEGLTVQRAWERVDNLAKAAGEDSPSYTTVNNYCRSVECRRARAYYRGAKHFERLYDPALRMDYDELRPLDVAMADHHRCDNFVVTSFKNGTPRVVRPYLTIWGDAKSRLILGWRISICPNHLTIAGAFADMTLNFGVPRRVKFDWGKDFLSRYFIAGCEHPKHPLSRREKELPGLFATLNIQFTAVKPYHGQSKVIERWFKEVVKNFAKRWPSYCGKDSASRPEQCAALCAAAEKQLKETGHTDLLPTLDEYTAAFDRWVNEEWHVLPQQRAAGMHGRSPLQVWNEEIDDRQVVKMPAERMKYLLMKSGRVTVVRDGIRMFNTSFWCDEVAGDVGRKCIARWDPDDLSELLLYDDDGVTPIGIAKQDPLASQLRDEGQFREIQRRKNLVRKKARAYDGARRSLDQIVREAHEQLIPDEPPEVPDFADPSNIEPLFGHPLGGAHEQFEALRRPKAVNAPLILDYIAPDPAPREPERAPLVIDWSDITHDEEE